MSSFRQAVHLLLATAVVLALLSFVTALDAVRLPGHQQGYAPEQPIEFSHLQHAGELEIDCLYCHHGAESSRHAGLPAASTCMNCHRFVTAPISQIRAEDERAAAAGREPEPVVSPELARLYDAVAVDPATGEPLPDAAPRPISWSRVHSMPDFVYFDHEAHVGAGVDCAECHGRVEAMVRVRQEKPLTMGFCIQCHRRTSEEGVLAGEGPEAYRVDVHATTDCTTCHY